MDCTVARGRQEYESSDLHDQQVKAGQDLALPKEVDTNIGWIV